MEAFLKLCHVLVQKLMIELTTMFMTLTMDPSNSNTIVEMDTEQHNNNIYFGS